MSGRCADLSLAAGEELGATAVTARRWLLVEVPGSWPRDVSDEGALPEDAREAVSAWLEATPASRLQFLRRPGRNMRQLLAYAVQSEEARGEVRRIELRTLGDLASLDLDSAGDPVETSLVLVCGHGSRDRCCALRGTLVFNALAERLGEEELWISSHQGGHRFAANVLVLPSGIQLGRLDPDAAPLAVAGALAGVIDVERYRGRTTYEPRVQAAEIAIRRATGLEGVDDLRVDPSDAVGETVVFRARSGERYAAEVEEAAGPSTPASCGVQAAPQRTFRARLV
jgi:hypothetical protein